MAKLEIENVLLRYGNKKGDGVVALEDISLSVEDGELSVIVGPSGCGKSSLLRLVAGLVDVTAGSIRLDGEEVTRPGKERGMVFQSYTLFPWLTVQANVEFGPRIAKMPNKERDDVARHFINEVGLTGFEKSYPKQLSGGMMQRVALARALANDPEVLLMDEPFGALDAQTRSLMQELLLTIWEHSKKTVLFITHDIDEAIFLGDRVYVMSARPGHIKEDFDVPIQRPRNVDVLTTPQFMEMKRNVMHLIHDEAVKAVSTGVSVPE